MIERTNPVLTTSFPLRLHLQSAVYESGNCTCRTPQNESLPQGVPAPSQDTALLSIVRDAVGAIVQVVSELISRLISQLPKPGAVSEGGADQSDMVAPAPASPGRGEKAPGATSTTRGSLGEGFLWKPESSKDDKDGGKLVVLLPEKFTGDVRSVELRSPDNKRRLEKGDFSGVANGDREHWRFDKPGKEYPKNTILRVVFEDGSSRTITIKRPGARLEG